MQFTDSFFQKQHNQFMLTRTQFLHSVIPLPQDIIILHVCHFDTFYSHFRQKISSFCKNINMFAFMFWFKKLANLLDGKLCGITEIYPGGKDRDHFIYLYEMTWSVVEHMWDCEKCTKYINDKLMMDKNKGHKKCKLNTEDLYIHCGSFRYAWLHLYTNNQP